MPHIVKNEGGYRIQETITNLWEVVNNDNEDENLVISKTPSGLRIEFQGGRMDYYTFKRYYKLFEMAEEFIREQDLF